MTYVQFYHLSSGISWDSESKKMIDVEREPIEMIGSDGVSILDGRYNRQNLIDTVNNNIHNHIDSESITGFEIRRGESFSRYNVLIPYQENENFVITRKQYLNRYCSFQKYNMQFVTDQTIQVVKNRIGENKICNSIDTHFNDIPLKLWDRLDYAIKRTIDMKKWKLANCPKYIGTSKFIWSLSDTVCISKAAARIIKENNNNAHYAF